MENSVEFRIDKYEVSCRTMNTILRYVQEQGKDINKILDGLPYTEEYLRDTNNWVSREVSDEISRRLREMFDDDKIMYKIGFASEKLRSLGFLDYVARLIGNPQIIIKNASILNKYFTKVDEIEVVDCSYSNATLKYYSKPGYKMTIDDCYYTKGILAALPTIWGAKPAEFWEEACSVPIQEKGKINGKFYTLDDKGYVSEHDEMQIKLDKDEPKIVGRLNSDGTFKIGNTVYGAVNCLYHIFWSPRKMWLKKIFYDFFTKPKVLEATIDEIQRENDIIQEKYDELYKKNLELQRHYVDTISALIRAIDVKDHYTEDHSLKIGNIGEAIAKEMGLSSNKIETIKQACKLHDLGKIGIKDSTLLKPGELSEEEWVEIKKHPILGSEIIKPLTFLSEVAILIRQDHERWDGKGYPDGLKGEEIDIGARIIAVADAYDAMISDRPYRKQMTKLQAIEEIKRNSGTQFDPKVVEAFLKVFQR